MRERLDGGERRLKVVGQTGDDEILHPVGFSERRRMLGIGDEANAFGGERRVVRDGGEEGSLRLVEQASAVADGLVVRLQWYVGLDARTERRIDERGRELRRRSVRRIVEQPAVMEDTSG